MQAQHSATANPAGQSASRPIVVVGPCAALHRGGIAYFTSRLVAALEQTDSVEFITWHELYPKWLLSREVTLPVSADPLTAVRDSLGFSNPLSWRRTAESIVALKPRRIVLNWVHPVHAPIYAYLLSFFKRRCDAERIVICHNVVPHERFVGDAALVRFALRSASQLIVHSEQEAQRAAALLPAIPARRVEMPSFSIFANGGSYEPLQDASLLYFGAIRPYKGVDLLLDAMVPLRNRFPGCTLTIAGVPFGRYGKLLKQRVAALQLEGITLDFRYIPDEEISQLFGRASLVVLPFREVTQSASLSLALGSELPVVTTDLPALRSCIAASDCVWTAQPNDLDSLVQTIITAVEAKSRRTRFRAVGPSWEQYAASITGAQP